MRDEIESVCTRDTFSNSSNNPGSILQILVQKSSYN